VLALVRVDATPWPGSESPTRVFEGIWPVVVRTQRRGNGGFGYDPHAWLPEQDRTVAELEQAEKAQLSHRGHALRLLLAWLREA
jgi:XTP/dITP diphosphohydrolase